MSVLGPSGVPVSNLAGSIAGAQERAGTAVDRIKADAAEQKLRDDASRLANRDLDDSVETDYSHGQVGDREPDGRLPWQAPNGQTEHDEAAAGPSSAAKPVDPLEERGRKLDLDA